MTAAELGKVRSTTVVKPAVRSASSVKKLQASLRRLGADESTIASVGRSAQNGRQARAS